MFDAFKTSGPDAMPETAPVDGSDAAPVTGGSPPPPDDVIVQMRNVHKTFGENHVLRGVSLSVKKGTSAVVLGGSGSGKSVLIRHIVGLLSPDQGEVWVKGQRVDLLDGNALDRVRLSIGYLFQGGALFDSMTVEENMRFYLDRHTTLSKGEKQDRIERAVEDVNLSQTLKQFPAELSGGQKKRIGLARAVILEPEIILYDEPTTGLDPVSVRVVSDLIVRLRDERGISSVAITHDLLAASIITDEAHFLYQGRFIASGSLDEIRETKDPILEEFFYGTEEYGT
ncbi:MAG: ATP-binding cassette domain-containing protein [Rhodothermales bacterium]